MSAYRVLILFYGSKLSEKERIKGRTVTSLDDAKKNVAGYNFTRTDKGGRSALSCLIGILLI